MVGDWKFDLVLSGHGGIGGDPEILNNIIAGKSFFSARYLKNGSLNLLLNQQWQEMDQEKRQILVNEIQEIYALDIPALILYYLTWYLANDKQLILYYTKQGVANGIPISLNKLSFIK
jgi:peptide/nickel transport system substrate-binding protein